MRPRRIDGMTSRDGKPRRILSYDERVLWTTVTKSIAPLHDDKPDRDEAPEPPLTPPPSPPSKRASRAPPQPPPQPPAKPAAPPLAPLGRRLRPRVARGRVAIDARMDLHGLTQAEAHAALARFLHAASGRGARLVLIITGKGGRGGGNERGVLRRQVPQWLALPEFRELVVGFEDAHVAHGGEGALYVRLRRRRGAGDED
jgi:DNA-nicking Smr family endonuclease